MNDRTANDPVRTGEVRAEAPFESHLGRVLVALERERATGVLELEAGRFRTTFYLHDGAVVFADAGTVGETLGRMLVRRGALSSDDYAVILRRMTEALVDDEVMRFGEVAIELGLVSPQDVSEALTRQVHEKLVRCLELDELRWVFRDDAESVARVARYPCPLVAATLEACSSPEDAATWELRLSRLGARALVLRPDASTEGLPPDALRVARRLDGTRSVADVLEAGERGLERRVAIVAALLVLDLCEVREAPAPRARTSLRPGRGRESRRPGAGTRGSRRPGASADTRTSRNEAPSPASTPAGAHPPGEPAAARRAPGQERAPAPGPVGPEPQRARSPEAATQRAAELRAELDRGRAAAARTGIARPATPSPSPVTAHKARLSAEQCYEHGRRALADGQLAVARAKLEAALAEMPEAVEYRLAAAFARWLTADGAETREAEAQAVKAVLVEQMRANRRCALAHYVHGRLSLAADQREAAARAFQTAARLEPHDREMLRWARHVGAPKKSAKIKD